ncbi:hypothetical protein FG386_001284 [Cryptosporidium ryanae]|uniref:uncharacterized protein n=1 Tax=Cryptosporidium ryanae TaxID=515981 RepID=UPI00351A3382|nr:hypothetical protein FG386_001284 [Cryptosporidium ryanae]
MIKNRISIAMGIRIVSKSLLALVFLSLISNLITSNGNTGLRNGSDFLVEIDANTGNIDVKLNLDGGFEKISIDLGDSVVEDLTNDLSIMDKNFSDVNRHEFKDTHVDSDSLNNNEASENNEASTCVHGNGPIQPPATTRVKPLPKSTDSQSTIES